MACGPGSSAVPGSNATRQAWKKKVTPNDCQNALFRSNFCDGGTVWLAISAVLGSAMVRLDDSLDLSLGSGASGRSAAEATAEPGSETGSSICT